MPVRLLRVVRQRLRALFRKDALDAELEGELAFHLEQLVQEFVDQGLTPEEARLAARRAIGNIPSLAEQCRDHRAVAWMHDLRRDLVFGVRMLRKNPGFTLVAVISLALGIGANTAILSVMSAVFRDSLPIPNDERLVVLRTFPLDNPRQETHALMADFFAWHDESRSFELMGAGFGQQADFAGDDEGALPERIQGQALTAEALSVLDVPPRVGRLFTESESRIDSGDRVILISHRLWLRRFGGRADIVGRRVRLNRVGFTIVGVMPEGFRYPNEGTDYWVPLRPNRIEPPSPQRFFVVTARLKPGVTFGQAQSDLDVIAARLTREDPDRHLGWGVRVRPLREAMLGWSLAPLFTLEAAVALLLLVACANLAALLLARGVARMPEMAVRTALGAGQGRLVRQLLTESVMLSIAGGALGTFVAWGGIRALVDMVPPPGGIRISEVNLDPRALTITALVSIVAGTLFGLAPAMIGARTRVTATLKGSPGGTWTNLVPRFRGGLVAAQVAVTFVLLIGSGLLMKSFVQVISRDLQFDPQRLLTFEYHMPLADFMQRRGSLEGLPYYRIDPPPSLTLERVYRGLRALPGVESVAGTSFPLLNSVVLPSMAVSVDDSGAGRSQAAGPLQALAIGVSSSQSHVADRRQLSAAYFLVTPGFFTSIGARLVDGRDFADSDTSTSQWVAIVNQSAAVRFWRGENPIGRQLRLPSVPDERPRTVIAVVRDIPLTRQGDPAPVVYTSYLQQPVNYPQPGANMLGRMTFMVRTTGDPIDMLPAARRLVAGIDPDRPLANMMTLESQLGEFVPQRGYMVLAITAFALTAMLLAAIGIYGVMSYAVAQRTREIGIRVALGAATGDVVRLVGEHVILVLSLGLSVGLAGALALTRLLQSQLWGVTPTDPLTFIGSVVVLAAAAVAACILPLRRATGVDAATALRCE
ncbi:MAG TPA: ABC transporter permease [Vicinamibacterales bacterium]|nr:ABC transporter permease [Vicinamibacterales bacterium]